MSTKRPTITPAMILEAAQQIAPQLQGDAEALAEVYRHPMDGYQIARELDRRLGWDLAMPDLEELDTMSCMVSELQRSAEKQWAEENYIQPPLPIGTATTKGVIEGVSDYMAAYYLVKEAGCMQKGRHLLVRFEDAVTAQQATT